MSNKRKNADEQVGNVTRQKCDEQNEGTILRLGPGLQKEHKHTFIDGELTKEFIVKIREHVHGLYAKWNIEIPRKWQNCVVYDIRKLLFTAQELVIERVYDHKAKMLGVNKGRFEVNAMINTIKDPKMQID